MSRKDIIKLFLRFLITFACSVPLLLLIGYFISGKVHDVVEVIIYVAVAGAVLALEEFIRFKLKQRREKLKKENE